MNLFDFANDHHLTDGVLLTSVKPGNSDDPFKSTIGEPFIGRSTFRPGEQTLQHSDLVDGYTDIVRKKRSTGYSCDFVTMTFHQFPGSKETIMSRIHSEVQLIFKRLITRVHVKPRTANPNRLPILIGALDLPVMKKKKSKAPANPCNEGLHFHAIVMIPPGSRLKSSLAGHFKKSWRTYASTALHDIDVSPITTGDEGKVVKYMFKTIGKRRLDYDKAILILPRTRREVEGGLFHRDCQRLRLSQSLDS